MLLLTIQPPTGRCLNPNEPGIILIGIIKAHTFPGRPNYESVARGDERERYWLLHLDKPICVEADDSFQKEQNVSRLQLVFEGDKPYEKYRPLLDRRVAVDGELFHRHTGHHHTRVLITVQAIHNRRENPRRL
jgi:hypothetical protein